MTTMAARDAAASMWERTDLKPADVDTAQLYDGFSVLTMVWLEALGFCGRGESGPFVEGGAIARDGVLPSTRPEASSRAAGCTASGSSTRPVSSCAARAASVRWSGPVVEPPRWRRWPTAAVRSPAPCC
jgi:hypothetical protein